MLDNYKIFDFIKNIDIYDYRIWVGVGLVVAGVYLIYRYYKKNNKKPEIEHLNNQKISKDLEIEKNDDMDLNHCEIFDKSLSPEKQSTEINLLDLNNNVETDNNESVPIYSNDNDDDEYLSSKIKDYLEDLNNTEKNISVEITTDEKDSIT